MKKPLLPFLSIILFFTQASYAQDIPSPSTLFKRHIAFGSGGGVTGAVRTYTLHEDGQVFVKESLTDSVKLHKTLNEYQTKDAFKCADQLKLDKYKFNHPGNLYKFIEYNNPKKKLQAKIIWGNTRYKVSKSTLRFYAKLIKMIQ